MKLLIAAQPTIDLESGVTWIKGFLLLLVMCALVYLALKGLLRHGQNGDYSSAISMVGASMICLVLVAMAGGVAVFTGYGSAVLGAITKILS